MHGSVPRRVWGCTARFRGGFRKCAAGGIRGGFWGCVGRFRVLGCTWPKPRSARKRASRSWGYHFSFPLSAPGILAKRGIASLAQVHVLLRKTPHLCVGSRLLGSELVAGEEQKANLGRRGLGPLWLQFLGQHAQGTAIRNP